VEGRAKQLATCLVIARYAENRVKPTKSAHIVVNRHLPNSGFAPKRRMRERDIGSQCADTIKLKFIQRSGTSELDCDGQALENPGGAANSGQPKAKFAYTFGSGSTEWRTPSLACRKRGRLFPVARLVGIPIAAFRWMFALSRSVDGTKLKGFMAVSIGFHTPHNIANWSASHRHEIDFSFLKRNLVG
jgi:hypothetical protein